MTEAPTPRIVTYESADAPASHRFVGLFFIGPKQLPVIFHGQQRNAVIEDMRNFWAEEQAKRAAIQANKAARSARQRARMQ